MEKQRVYIDNGLGRLISTQDICIGKANLTSLA